MTRHTDPLTRILNTYMGGPGIIPALTAYIEGQMAQAAERAREDMAEAVCERLHDSRPAGIKCLSCYSAEMNVKETLLVESEIEAARREPRS